MHLHLEPLTLIVATTASLGIGRGGTLPWPHLKQEMAYFAAVTKRSPNPALKTINAVIMGRKTWDSVQPKYRPLKDRLNVVISKSMQASSEASGREGPLIARSFDHALDVLRQVNGQGSESIGQIFVIGGASIYAAALKHSQTGRVLLTKILKPDFECDTFFPIDLDGEEAKSQGWTRKSTEELKSLVGDEALAGKDGERGTVKKQGDIEWEYCMYERSACA